MSEKQLTPISEILDETLEFSLVDLAQHCYVQVEIIIEMVEEGVVEPLEGQTPEEWRFTGPDLIRLHRALRLQQDFEINPTEVALVIDLLEEIDALRSRVKRLERHLMQ